MKQLRIIVPLVSLIIALAMATLATAQDELSPGVGNVNFTVQNLDPVETAVVIASFINSSGMTDTTWPQEAAPLSAQGFPISDSGLPDNWQGAVIIASDRELVGFAQARWQDGTHGDGKTAGAYNAFAGGVNALYFPSLAARQGKQFSLLSIQSAEGASESESIDVTVAFYDREGTPAKDPFTFQLLKGTQITLDLMHQNLGGDDDMWLGAAVVTSDSPIAGMSAMHWQTYSGAYSGVAGGGTNAYLPSATRRIRGGTAGVWRQYTAVLVQNLDPLTDATVWTHWYDRNGNELYSFSDVIPANSSHGYNTRWTDSNVPGDEQGHHALHEALGTDWNGSVVVTSTVNIVAIANLQWTADSPVGNAATTYASEPAGYDEIYVPANFRRVEGGTLGVWRQFTGLVVQNIGASACDSFSVQWFARTGEVLLDYDDALTEVGQSHGYNTRWGADGSDVPASADTGLLGDDFRGSVYVSAPGCELIAIHNTLWPLWTDSTTYNAFGK